MDFLGHPFLYSMIYGSSIRWKQKNRESVGVTKATVSNVTNTLERFCYRQVDKRDRRITYVAITEKGKLVMEDLYPRFHKGEAEIVSSLTIDEQKNMSKLLRKVIKDCGF